jgi:hypothetical protein
MLWPFVRNPGDCLTDAEIASGQKGVYSGPVNTNVDVSAIKPADVPPENNVVSGSGTGGLLSGGPFGDGPSNRAGQVTCNKGAFWPFVREPGDCLTDVEKKQGKTGVFGGGAGVTQVSAAAPGAPNANGAQTPAPTPAPESPPAGCERSWFWPFVRTAGDCPTDADKQGEKK